MDTTSEATPTRDIKGRFLPGNKVGGRPMLPLELKKVCREKAAVALAVTIAIMEDESQPTKYRLKAAEIVLDRAYGKPTQHIDADVTTEQRIPYLVDEEADGHARAIARLCGGGTAKPGASGMDGEQ